MPTAAEIYAELVRNSEPEARAAAPNRPAAPTPAPRGVAALGERWGAGAARFREDPFRENETLAVLTSFIRRDDTVLDVGGGAGRYLPLALHCREYVNCEPAAGMGAQFEAAVKDAGVTNARWYQTDWFEAEIEGDVAFCANVVYYIRDIETFVRRLDAASRRRVMIVMHSVPPTNVGTELYRLVNQREQALAPGHRELLPVLWDMGLLPDVHVLGPSDFIVERNRYASREEALSSVLPARLEGAALDAVRDRLETHFDEVFVPAEGGYMRRPVGTAAGHSRVLLITWETRH